MKNAEIARHLKKISLLMQIRGVNPFKIRAYERVIRTVKSFSIPMEELVNNGQLLSVDGIGKGIGEVITEIVQTGKSIALEELMEGIPETIFEIVEIPGIGPRKAAFLFKQTGIASLKDLERAAVAGSLSSLKGFGKKTQEKILKGIELRKYAFQHKSIGFSLPIAREIIAALRETGLVRDISEAGGIRRGAETSENLCILCSTNSPAGIIEEFVTLPIAREILEKNEDWASIIVKEDFPVKLYLARPGDYWAALFLTTGSEKHIEAVNSILGEKGFRPWKDRILSDSEGNRVPVLSEEAIYLSAGLPFIPPEIRETGEEVEIFKSGKKPDLICREDLRGDMQMHSTYSDGSSSIRDMAEKAMQLGYSYIAITDHSRSLVVAHGLNKERVKKQHDEIDRLNAGYKDRFRIFKAAEVDILSDGTLDYEDEILETMDFVLASIHLGMGMPGGKMTERVLKAIRHPMVHCLAHPSGRLIGRRREFEMDWKRIFMAARDSGIAIEINAHPSRLDLNEKRCRIASEMGIPIMINTDAHSPDDLELIEYGINVARRGWLSGNGALNTLSTEEMNRWLVNKSSKIHI